MEKAIAVTTFKGVSITSDGTREGTSILVNGKAVEDLASFSFWFYNDSYGNPVSFSYTTRDKDPKPGELSKFTSYSLVPPTSKANAALQATASTDDKGFTIQSSRVIPIAHLRGDEQRKAYAQI